MKKNKKSIFITGAASGIGKATAVYFAKMGWEVGLFDINEDGLEDVAKEIGHNSCMYQKLDVTNIEEWNSARESFGEYTNGKCDLFFNNAGIANFTGRVEDIPIKEYKYMTTRTKLFSASLNLGLRKIKLSKI